MIKLILLEKLKNAIVLTDSDRNVKNPKFDQWFFLFLFLFDSIDIKDKTNCGPLFTSTDSGP